MPQLPLQIKLGDDIMENGFTALPNKLISNYARMGLSDSAFTLIIHLLKFKWDERNPYPRLAHLPTSCCRETRRRQLHSLREAGLLFTRQLRRDGRVYAQEYDFRSLFYNVVRASHLACEEQFIVELPTEIVEKVATNHFDDVPDAIMTACTRHYTQELNINPKLRTPLLLTPQKLVLQNVAPEKLVPQIVAPQIVVPQIVVGSNKTKSYNKKNTEEEKSSSSTKSHRSLQKQPPLATTPRQPQPQPQPDGDDDDHPPPVNSSLSKILHECGITRNEKTAPLFESASLTPEDVRTTVERARQVPNAANPIGLAIHWLLNGEIAKGEKADGPDTEPLTPEELRKKWLGQYA